MSPSESVAEPVSVNGVRVGIVLAAGAVTTGEWSVVAVTVPPLVSGPPLTMVPTEALDVPTTGVTVRVCWSLVVPQLTVNPLALGAPAPS